MARARAEDSARPSVPAVRHSRLTARLIRLYLGLVGFGVSLALMVRARLGLDPWDVLHQGIARHLGVQIGWVTIAVSGIVLLAWIPLRQRPGLGTVSNAIIVGLVVNGALGVLPAPGALAWRAGLLAAGIGLNGVATASYVGAGLGPGARDGLMTGLAARGHSLRVVRTVIELSVLVIGAALGGTVGLGTLVYALSIGPLTHLLLPRLAVAQPDHEKGTSGHDRTDPGNRRADLSSARRRSGRPGLRGRTTRL